MMFHFNLHHIALILIGYLSSISCSPLPFGLLSSQVSGNGITFSHVELPICFHWFTPFIHYKTCINRPTFLSGRLHNPFQKKIMFTVKSNKYFKTANKLLPFDCKSIHTQMQRWTDTIVNCKDTFLVTAYRSSRLLELLNHGQSFFHFSPEPFLPFSSGLVRCSRKSFAASGEKTNACFVWGNFKLQIPDILWLSSPVVVYWIQNVAFFY